MRFRLVECDLLVSRPGPSSREIVCKVMADQFELNISDLPNELLKCIFDYLDCLDVWVLSQVQERLFRIALQCTKRKIDELPLSGLTVRGVSDVRNGNGSQIKCEYTRPDDTYNKLSLTVNQSNMLPDSLQFIASRASALEMLTLDDCVLDDEFLDGLMNNRQSAFGVRYGGTHFKRGCPVLLNGCTIGKTSLEKLKEFAELTELRGISFMEDDLEHIGEVICDQLFTWMPKDNYSVIREIAADRDCRAYGIPIIPLPLVTNDVIPHIARHDPISLNLFRCETRITLKGVCEYLETRKLKYHVREYKIVSDDERHMVDTDDIFLSFGIVQVIDKEDAEIVTKVLKGEDTRIRLQFPCTTTTLENRSLLTVDWPVHFEIDVEQYLRTKDKVLTEQHSLSEPHTKNAHHVPSKKLRL